MRNLLSTTALLFTSFGLFAQTTLTRSTNGLISGDSYTIREIEFVTPGSDGLNQIWDYFKINYSDKNPVSEIKSNDNLQLSGLGDHNLTLNEGGYNFFLNTTDSKIEEMGYINKEKNMNLVYSNPVLKMKYPFAYGDQFTDPFTAVAYFNENYRIDFSGENKVTADATGTLILPDMVIKDALRVKTQKTGIQVNPCGSVKINISKYAWYATGYRYPVMIITIVENKFSNGKTEIIQTASTNTSQYNSNVSNSSVGSSFNGSLNASGKNDVSVSLFPNPFSDKITYNYFLRSKLPVSITLFDLAGKYSEQIVQNDMQSEGLHIGSLENVTSKLPAGVYYLRFIFDQQVVVSKVVKLQNN